MRLLLTGAEGQLGHELLRLLEPQAAFNRQTLNLLDTAAVRRAIETHRPDVILNAAAYTAVDQAESQREQAFAVNATAVGVMAKSAASMGCLLVHFSTDYVFDGEKPAPYRESDVVRPLNVYGESKLAGEQAIAASGCRNLIFRTSWVYGARGRNFLRSILAAAREGRELKVVEDQRGAPTSSAALAAAVAQVLARADLSGLPGGLYHLSAAGETTWHGFAVAALRGLGIAAPVQAIGSAQYGALARRPRSSLLDNAKAKAVLGVALADWREQLSAVLPSIH